MKITLDNELIRVFFSTLHSLVWAEFNLPLKATVEGMKKYVNWQIHEFYFALQTLTGFELEFNEKDLKRKFVRSSTNFLDRDKEEWIKEIDSDS